MRKVSSERDASRVTSPSQQPSDQHSVLSLLKMLHDRVRQEKRSSFQQILPAYEQLLTHIRQVTLSMNLAEFD
ncbi:Gamma-tubulin complex component 6 [Globisporangium polare]